jgi:hypothetical protein
LTDEVLSNCKYDEFDALEKEFLDFFTDFSRDELFGRSEL